MNDWLVTWMIEENDNRYSFKQECQYVANVTELLQREIFGNEGLLEIKIEPLQSNSNLKGLV